MLPALGFDTPDEDGGTPALNTKDGVIVINALLTLSTSLIQGTRLVSFSLTDYE